jgi:hypothetical protein
MVESDDSGRESLICRAMNWRSARHAVVAVPNDLAQRILKGLAQPGVHRALVDLKTWTLLKWLDDPCPFYDWRTSEKGEPAVHPEDAAAMIAMTAEFGKGASSRVLRLRAVEGGFTPIHVTVHRVELEEGVVAALLSMRLPTEEEVAASAAAAPKPRKVRGRKAKPKDAATQP